jgi:hypothetical protein
MGGAIGQKQVDELIRLATAEARALTPLGQRWRSAPCLAVSRPGEVDWTNVTRLLLWELGSTMGSPHNALRSVQSLTLRVVALRR